MQVELLVEGYADELFIRRCFELLDINIGTVYGKQGVNYLIQKANGFAARGEYSPILILADLMDMPEPCPATARDLLVPLPKQFSLVRFAVREIESWLIASRAELARYFGISETHVPYAPDELQDPKQSLINIARRSPRGRLRNMFVPKPSSSASVGAGYVDGFADFMREHWDLESARRGSPSFARFVERAIQCFRE